MAPDQPVHSTERQDDQPLPQAARVILLTALVGLMVALGWIIWTAGRDRLVDGRGGLSLFLAISKDVPSGGRYRGDPYIGHRVCAECHPGEYALFTRSGHAQTIRSASERRISDQLAGRTVPDPERPDVRWTYAKEKGEFLVQRRDAGKIERFVIDYAVGSGHHATTFVTVLDLDPAKILEHRLTYYTREGTLGITPGQTGGPGTPGMTPAGAELSDRDTIDCFGCHATQLSAHAYLKLDPLMMIPNVTCEKCHGPGRAHVEAARRGVGAGYLSMPMGLDGWTVQSQLELCGRCHRHPSRALPQELIADDPFLARFQPVGLSQSRCFKESAGRLSCVSCHDPHDRSSSDRTIYERVCLSCHVMSSQGKAEDAERARSHPAATTVCPVSPLKGCIACHMPGVDSGQHVLFSDHWIRVRRPAPGM
jgi:Cytochrome c554 and c-prime